MYKRNWLDKLITHNRDKVGDFGSRLVLHIGIGLLIGIPIVGRPLKDLFIRYEENEDLHTKDQAWKDYAGAMVGTVVTSLVVLAGVIWFILFLLDWLKLIAFGILFG